MKLDTTVGELLAGALTGRDDTTKHDDEIIDQLLGENVFIRTVTLYYTGRLKAIDASFFELDGAAWIANTGRFSDALKDGEKVLLEVEPYPGPGIVYVNRDTVVDICVWEHELPRTKK